MRTVFSIMTDAVAYGMVLFIISIGLSIMMGLMRVVNLAHGAFAMIGGYLASYAIRDLHVHYSVAMLMAVIGTIIVSIPFEILLYRRIYRKSDPLIQVLMTIGITFFIIGIVNFIFGPSLNRAERAVLPMRAVERGEVLVFKFPEEPDRDFIKRVIGLPGETLELRNKKVFIDGKPIDEPYVHFLEPASNSQEVTSFDVRERYGPVKVPADQFFVMGDNRDNSQDSRYWGFLPRTYIKGKALMIYWSYESGSSDYVDNGVGATVERLFSVVTHFATRTRWERLFKQIH